MVWKPGCPFHRQSLGAQGLGVHPPHTPPTTACLGKGCPTGQGGGATATPRSHRHTRAPFRCMSHRQLHTSATSRTHIHIHPHTLGVQVVSLAYGGCCSGQTSQPRPLSSAVLSRGPEGEFQSELTWNQVCDSGQLPDPKPLHASGLPRSTPMPWKGRRPLSWGFQFSSVAQSRPTLCDPLDRSTPGLPIHHQLLELTQTHVH